MLVRPSLLVLASSHTCPDHHASLAQVVFYTATQTAQPEQTYRIGTMATAAPEVIWKSLGEKRYGTEVDIYSVSITVLQGVLGAGSVYASVDSEYYHDQETLHEAVVSNTTAAQCTVELGVACCHCCVVTVTLPRPCC